MTSDPKPRRIDRDAQQPVYLQLAEILREQILSGALRPGEKLPPETALAETYAVSPMTVRRAINLLSAQDILNTSRGRATSVKQVDLVDASFTLRELKGLFHTSGHTSVRLIDTAFVKADARVSRKLDITPGKRAIYIRRLVFVDFQPAYFHRGYYIPDATRPVLESELQVTDLRGLFRSSSNALIKSGDVSIEATTLTEEEAGLLRLPLATPAMILEHLFYDFKDRPISWGWFTAASDRLRLTTRVGFENAPELLGDEKRGRGEPDR